MDDHGLIDSETPDAALEASEARSHRAGDDTTPHLDVVVHYDLLDLVAEIGHGGQCVLPHGVLGLDALRGEAKRRVNDCVGMKQVVEGLEVTAIAGSQPSEDDCLAGIGHTRISRRATGSDSVDAAPKPLVPNA